MLELFSDRFQLARLGRAAFCCGMLALVAIVAAPAANAQMFAHPDREPQVNLRFDRYHNFADITAALKELERTYPRFLTLKSIGESVEGREIWLMIINNPDTGPHTEKPAFFADANIHGNELQGTEINLYIIWFLMENYDALPRVQELVDSRTFYIVPTMNPDGREYYMTTGGPSRSGMAPYDSNLDGRPSADPPVDLTGDGEIRQMRKYVPGQGTHIISPIDPRLMVVAPRGEKGDYIMLGREALDQDGTGRRGSDPLGGYDMNRDFPSDWQPPHIQRGANRYPFTWPETRAVADFLKAHPNIAALQTWHNMGGMILRGPGSQHYAGTGEYARRDIRAYDYLGRRGELMLPYYRYLTVYRDLYTVYGGTLDWAHDALGAVAFCNELWSYRQLYNEAWRDDGPVPNEMNRLFFNDKLGMGAWFKDWEPFDHPELGNVEIGGWSKWFGRITPPFLLQELVHRNAMFALFHAEEMPQLEWSDIGVERISGNTYRVQAEVRNTRAIPTRLQAAQQRSTGVPDYFSISGNGIEVHVGGFTSGQFNDEIRMQEREPESIQVNSGVDGQSFLSVTWIVTGRGTATIEYSSQKAGTLRTEVRIPATDDNN